MKSIPLVLCLLFVSGAALGQSQTVSEVTQFIIDNNAYVRANLQTQDNYSMHGALEFWSSGGLLHEIDPDEPRANFDVFNIEAKHIHVLPLVEGQAAVAHYYSEGSMKPAGSAAVSNYLTRVSQVFVKEDGEWKIRSSHWSPVAGGAGTSQTALE